MIYTICWFVGHYEMINGSKSWPDFYFLWYDILFSGTVLPCSTDFVKLLWRTSKTKPWNILAHLWLVSTAWIGHVLFWILEHTATQRYNFIWTSHSFLIWCFSCFHSYLSIIIILVCYFFVLAPVTLPPLISHFFSHYVLPSLLSPLFSLLLPIMKALMVCSLPVLAVVCLWRVRTVWCSMINRLEKLSPNCRLEREAEHRSMQLNY